MATDRRAYENEWADQIGQGSNSPISNPLGSAGIRSIRHDTYGRNTPPSGIYMGRVIESFSYLATYRVLLENGSVVQCSAMSGQSVSNWGPSISVSYNPMQDVVVLLRASAAHGIILGAIPSPVVEPNDWRPDALFSGSNVGYYVDATDNRWTGLDANDLIDFSSGRPYDVTSGPEQSSQGLLGVGSLQDDFITFMKVDEETGIFGLYDDSLLRVAGHNLQIRSTGYEEERLDDEGELNHYAGETPYRWESMGAYKQGVETSKFIFDQDENANPENQDEPADTSTGNDKQLEGIKHGFVQPMAYDQQSFHRVVHYGGYLGQAGHDLVIIPGIDVEGSEDTAINTYSQDSKWLSVSSEHHTLPGRHVVAGSNGMMFVKRPPMPTPKRKERPESPLGDLGAGVGEHHKNYDPAGLPPETASDETDTATSTHFVVDEIPIEDLPKVDGEPAPDTVATLKVPFEVLRSAAMADEIAYSVSWEGLHTFHYHSKDFYLPQESDLGEYNKSVIPPYESLALYQHLGEDEASPYPDQISVKVDHRYGEVNIYLNTAFFGLRADGTWVMRDGYGSEIKSENGNIVIGAPGDIKLQPGRNLVMLAGHDAICKARNSVDISSTENDIRLFAWKNMMLASAVSEEGAMVLQSFSKCVVDPEVENTINPEDMPDDGDNDEDDPADGQPPQYNMGEEVIGSGILLKSRRAQVTVSSYEASVEVGRKKYNEEEVTGDGKKGKLKPEEFDPSTGKFKERDWTWAPGRIRLSAEKGQIETFSSYFVNYLMDPAPFTNEGAEDSPAGATGEAIQVFLRTKKIPTDDPLVPLDAGSLPPNILAAAGVADISSTNTCAVATGKVCYEVSSVNEFRADRSTICASLLVNKELFVGGCEYVRGNLTVIGHLDVNFEPVSYDGGLIAQQPNLKTVFDEADTRCLQLLPPLMADSAGKFIEAVSGAWLDFSLRTPEQYGTSKNFCIMETWWQHQVRVEAERKANENPDPDNPPPEQGEPENKFNFYPDLPKGIVYWTESYVETLYANLEKTSPYPGIDFLHVDDGDEDKGNTPDDPDQAEEAEEIKRCYGVFELSLVDEDAGRPKDRKDLIDPEDPESLKIYEDPKIKRGAVRQLDHYIAIDVLVPEVEEATPDDPDNTGG